MQWKTNFFTPIQNDNFKLTCAILRLIERQRNDQVIGQGLIERVLGSFVSLGLDEDDINRVQLDVYKVHFEAPFLGATEKHYELRSRTFLAENSISNYLKKAEEWLKEEEGRAERYLNTETRGPLISSCVDILVREHLELMYEASQSFFAHDRDEDLQGMYGLLARTPDDLEPLRTKFEEHLKWAGLTAVLRVIEEGGRATEVNPKAYVDGLFEVYRKGSEMVKRNFKGEAGFVACLDRACGEFINRNAATGAPGARSCELLTKHADNLLRWGNQMAVEYPESTMGQVVCTFSDWLSV